MPQIQGYALEPRLPDVVKSWDAADVIRCGDRSELHAEVADGHEFKLRSFCQRAIGAGALGEASGRLVLKFSLANLVNIGSDREGEQVLCINFFSAAD